MVRNGVFMSSACALILTLSGCGGGAGSGGALVSTPSPPPPTPPPPPPPPPAPTPRPFGVTTSQQFATSGVIAGFADGQGRRQPVSAPADAVEFSWSESAAAYEMRVPGASKVTLGHVSASTYEAPDGKGSKFVVSIPDKPSSELQLSYTSYASWYLQTGPSSTAEAGVFAFGIPSAASEVPTTGSGTYAAQVIGDNGSGYWITGQAQLVFDFGAGSLTGHMQPKAVDGWGIEWPLGRYDFTQTVFGKGSTSFSGKFAVSGSTASSFFEGRFTGPAAAELMARWSAPFKDPYGETWSTMQGIWIGKRQ